MNNRTILPLLILGMLCSCNRSKEGAGDKRIEVGRHGSPSSLEDNRDSDHRTSTAAENEVDNDSEKSLEKLAGKDPHAALKEYFKTGNEIDVEHLEEFAKVLFTQHPGFILEWLKADFPGESDMSLKARLVEVLSSVFAKQDPSAAFRIIDQLNGSPFQATAIQSAFRELGLKDPGKALEEAKSHYQGKVLDSAIIAIASGEIETSPENAIKTLQSVSSKSERVEAIARLLGNEALANFERIAPVLESMDSKSLCELLASSTTKTLVGAVLENDLSLMERSLKDTVINNGNWEVFALYARKTTQVEYAKGIQFLETMPDSPLKAKIVDLTFGSMSDKDFDSAFTKALALDGNLQTSALNGIALYAGKNGIEEVVSMLGKVPPEAGDAIVYNAVRGMVASHFDDALEYVTSNRYLESATSDQSRSNVVQSVANAYASKDPDAAFQWINTLGGESKSYALEAYAKQKSRTDIEGLSEQLAAMPHDEAWRAGVKVLVSELRNTDEARSKEWERALDQN